MNITNAYLNMLRYVSASGKRTVLETMPQAAKKGTIFKCAKAAEYKSVPLGMPKETKSFTYEKWEDIVLRKGETKHYALNSWFNFIKPRELKISRIEQELNNCFTKENIEKIEFFKTLSPQEKNYLTKCYANPEFISTLSGHKPAWFCESGFNRRIDFSKIKLNPKIADKFDVVRLPNGKSLYFLNKQEVLKIIEENRDIYCAGQGLNLSEDIEIIYQTLLKNLERGQIAQGKKGEALYGITLGFPRHSSMIFEMESAINGYQQNLRSNIPLFKEKLLDLLHSEKSPFKGFPKETIEKLEHHIRSMESEDAVSKSFYQCQIFGNEERAIKRMLDKEKDFADNFKVEDLM